MMIEALRYGFMQNALLCALLISIACGIVGTYVVIKRIVSLSGGIAHTAFGGVGLGYLLGINPLIAAIPWSLASAIALGLVSRFGRISEDTAMGVFWALGMALGILFISLSPGYAPDLFGYLFGNILTVPAEELLVMGALDLLMIGSVALLFKEMRALCFDEEFSEIAGLPTKALYLALLCMVALSVVIMMKAVGIILVIALLTLPAAIARQRTHSLSLMMLYAIGISMLFTVGGLVLSFMFDLPSGATIIILLGAGFLASSALARSVCGRCY